MPSLLEALDQKYGEVTFPISTPLSDEAGISVAIYVPCRPARAAVPALLVLNDCNIATAGEREALIAKCSNVEELDLAKNKLDQWEEVFGILENMPRLKFVNLSFNSLSKPLEVNLDKSKNWAELRSLVLNSTHVGWESVQRILDHLPYLDELHLSLNDYNNVELHQKQEDCECNQNKNDNCDCQNYKIKHKHSVIKIVHFTGNPVDNWKEISKLGYAFPNLESLVLAECPIKALEIDDQVQESSNKNYEKPKSSVESADERESPHDPFTSLKVLNLNSTMLSSWDDIEKLSKFPVLRCLRVQGCPLWECQEYTEHERRQLLIARLPNVQTLNGGGAISTDEREDAERAFIRYYMDKPESDRPERYFDLVNIHGKLDPLVNVSLRPEKRVKVTFTCGSNSEVRTVDVYRTVSDLKTRLEGFAGFPASKMRLFYVDQDQRDTQGPELMRFPSKQLFSYNIRSGDEIIIVSKLENKKRNTSESKKAREGNVQPLSIWKQLYKTWHLINLFYKKVLLRV